MVDNNLVDWERTIFNDITSYLFWSVSCSLLTCSASNLGMFSYISILVACTSCTNKDHNVVPVGTTFYRHSIGVLRGVPLVPDLLARS